jgi:tetratricopeptide (TPR) repeat protein
MWGKGHAAEETEDAFARVGEFAGPVERTAARFVSYHAQFLRHFTRGELLKARETAESFLREAETEERAAEAGAARSLLGLILLHSGNPRAARSTLERALADYDPVRDHEAQFQFGADTDVRAAGNLALAEWHLGEVERARQTSDWAIRRAHESGRAATLAIALLHKCILEIRRNDASAAQLAADAFVGLMEDKGVKAYGDLGQAFAFWARGRLVDPEAGAGGLRRALAAEAAQGNRRSAALLHGLLAELEALTRGPDSALASVDEGLAIAEDTGDRFTDPYLHRLRGDILLKRDPANRAPAEEAFQTAIAIAKQQGARSYELLASLSLAKLYQSTARATEAHAVLALALEGFSPTPEMPEIAEAQALLAALAETDQVKRAIAQRQRRLDLQTSYGHALMWGKGYGAEETRAAFARVREFAGPAENPVTRFAAYDAQSLSSHIRGEHAQGREAAEFFLREAEAEGRATEAGAARRALGLACLMQGDLKAARSVLERALSDYLPERDAETQFMFGRDTEVAAAAYLAVAKWHLGEVERARHLIERSSRRADELGHGSVIAKAFTALLESRRNDASATRLATDAALRLTKEYGIKTYADALQVFATWANGRLLDPEAGASGMRQALAAYMAQGNKAHAPAMHGLLAELEVATQGLDRALTLIDRGLAIADETGEHLTDPYLFRLRGELMFRRDPGDPAPAEEAFQTAITIAKEQDARSYDLLASLSWAKLCKSTARPTEAHTVLAPVLEGFSPTPEMPEIAEAQALLERLPHRGDGAIPAKDPATEG